MALRGHREEILAAVREALRNTRGADLSVSTTAVEEQPTGNLALRFAEELENVGGHFLAASGEEGVKDFLSELIMSRSIHAAALSDAPIFDRLNLRDWLGGRLERLVTVPPADLPSRYTRLKAELADVPLGITSCRFAIADTGTVLITMDDETNRLMSLLPMIHVVLFTPEQLVPNLSQALRRIRADGDLGRAITLISGPSRTGDIELTLTVGVHGPKEIHAILVMLK